MALDKFSNTGLSTLASGIDASQLTATLAAGTGSRFPADTFNVVIWASSDFANPIDAADREIVRCTSRAGDVLTIVRGQEGTTGVAHNTVGKTYSVALIVSKKFRDDLHALIIQNVSTQVFTASGTYTKPANLIAARVICVARGGNGSAASTSRPGSGGGSGGYSESFLLASAIGATEAVTLGGAGADTSFGALVIAKAGSNGGIAGVGGAGGAGGVAGTGQVALAGGDGVSASAAGTPGGHGGSSAFGGAGRGGGTTAGGSAGAGQAGKANTGGGGGGGGGNEDGTGNAAPGGAGGSGIVIVQEFKAG